MLSFLKQLAIAACVPLLVTASYPIAVIVESDGTSHWEDAEGLTRAAAVSLRNVDLACTVSRRYAYNHWSFRGSSLSIDCNTDLIPTKSIVTTIRSIEGVGNVWPITTEKPPSFSSRGTGISKTKLFRRRHEQNNHERGLTLNNNLNHRSEADSDTVSTHIDTGVARLRAENITGAGIRVAVLDGGFDLTVPGLSLTSVDYTHDMINGGDEVQDECWFHGTHVLGIIGAKGNGAEQDVSGVAPDATYELFRIQSCDSSSATEDARLASLIDAADRGVDITTCSYGSPGAWPEDPWTSVADRIAANGTLVFFPAGNRGPGIFTGNSPADGDYVTAVGSVDNSVTPYYSWEATWSTVNSSAAGSFSIVPSSPFNFPNNTKLTVWAPDVSASDDCLPMPDRSSLPDDLSNVVLLSKYNQCWLDAWGGAHFLTEAFNISYALYYPGKSNTSISDGPLFASSDFQYAKGVATVDYNTASMLLAARKEHGSLEISTNAVPNVSYKVNRLSGLLSSKFTGWGPTRRALSMPLFLAPGGNILSTLPQRFGGLGVLSGTSMSTPFGAGVAALVKQKHPEYSADDIRNVIATTARPVNWNDAKGHTLDFLAPTFQQGGGLVDAWSAVHTTTLLSTASWSFNDTVYRATNLTFSIKNSGEKTVKYRLSHIGAGSGYVLGESGYNLTKAEAYPVYADIYIHPTSLEIKPGSSAMVSVSVIKEPDMSDAATRVSHFSGYVAIEAEGETNKLTLPYTGLGAPLLRLPAINRDTTILAGYNSSNDATIPLTEERIFNCTLNTTMNSPVTFQDNFHPGVKVDLVVQSRDFTLSIVDTDSGKEMFVMTRGSSEDPFLSGWTWYYDGTDADYFHLPAGRYHWRAKALKITGDPKKKEDYDTWESGSWILNIVS
ncbi:minor extracellular protease vpr [Fusarium circinatum]|uniref:Minor extracellular protease vpr n=1 Tax=Fusarium circinatum TaxID=48490 RepID=A0A8H5WRB8_FUSCI|nr:minor extracellular protease vpr [Fusarium circinatum]